MEELGSCFDTVVMHSSDSQKSIYKFKSMLGVRDEVKYGRVVGLAGGVDVDPKESGLNWVVFVVPFEAPSSESGE